MQKLIKFGILGGDLRYKYVYDMLKKEGFFIKSYENTHIEDNEKNIDNFLKQINFLIAPMPIFKNDKTILEKQFTIDEFLCMLNKHNIKNLACGLFPKDYIKKAAALSINIHDILEYEEFAILNAIPTAEGAIQMAMQESNKTIFGNKCLVLGYGRCGKILANMLKGIGADTFATYRTNEEYSYIYSAKINSFNLKDLKDCIKNFDFIFNTIPFCILDKKILENIKKDCTIIDLAKSPGGVDYSYSAKNKLNAIFCPGLPGRVAPYTAGKILKAIILKICSSIK